MQKTNKIFILQPRIQHYRLPVFDQLIIQLKGKFKIKVFGLTDNGKAFNGGKRNYLIHLNYIKIFGIEFWPKIINRIFLEKPSIIISTASPRNLTCWILPYLCFFLNIKLIGWGKVNSNKENINFGTEIIKKLFYSRYNYMIVYGEKSQKELKGLCINSIKVVIAHNTINTQYILNKKSEIIKNSNVLRHKFKLNQQDKVFIVIGRMIPEKKQYEILKAWFNSELKNDKKNKLVFVGSGQCFKKIKSSEEAKMENVIITGSAPYKFDYAWLYLSDVSIFGGAVGLACQQAMALKTLVIAPKENLADTEILKNQKNCILFKKNKFDQLTLILNEIDITHKKYKDIVDRAYIEIFRNFTIENMVKKILQSINS